MKSKIVFYASMALCLIGSVFFSFANVEYSSNERINAMIKTVLPIVFAMPLATWFVLMDRKKLFLAPTKLGWIALCLPVAVNNLPWLAWIEGACSLIDFHLAAFLLFVLYCLAVAAFEEFVFRGVIFPYCIERFSKDNKGLFYAIAVSSAVFGLAHLANLFSGAGIGTTLLQVGYTTLVGGLFAFSLVKIKNIFAPVLLHFIYNFCGLLFDESMGLGYGVAWSVPSVVLTAVIGVGVGVGVLIALFSVTNTERKSLYVRMGISA